MKYYISCFNKIDTFTENCIPISTAGGTGWPYWLYKYYKQPKGSYFLSKNNVMLGITEEKFSCFQFFEKLDEKCGQKPCPYSCKVPHCQFMDAYLESLRTLNLLDMLKEFERVAEDVRKITNYKGEPNIILMVYEQPSCNCAERPMLQKWFKENGFDLKEWSD